MIRVLFTLFLSLSVKAQVTCLGFYHDLNQSGVLIPVASLLQTKPFELDQVLEQFSEKSIQEVKDDIYNDLKIKRQFLKENREQLDSIAGGIDRLGKHGFFLSDFHQLLFLKAAHSVTKKNNLYISGSSAVNRHAIKAINSSIQGSRLEHLEFRKKIAKEMYDFATTGGTIFSTQGWESLSIQSRESFSRIQKEYKFGNIDTGIVGPALDEFITLSKRSDGQEIITKIFEYSLPEVSELLFAKSRGVTGHLIRGGLPVSMGIGLYSSVISTMSGVGMWDWISTAAIDHTGMFASLAAVSAVSLSSLVGISKTLSSLPDVPGKVRGWIKKRKTGPVATLRAVERAEMDIHDSQEQQARIKENDNMIAKLDIDFNRIKSELKYNQMNDIVAVGKWSNEFTYALGILGERTSVIAEKMRRLDDLMLNADKTLRDEHASMDLRNEAREKLEFSKNSVLETFAQVAAFKYDLLMMSRAFDHYLNAIISAKSSGRLTQDQLTLLSRKETLFEELKVQITSLGVLSAKWSIQLIGELNKIDQMDAIVNTNSILSGMDK